MTARDNKLETTKLARDDPWQTDWFKELRKLLWPTAEIKAHESPVDSSRSAPIFSPNLDGNKQKMVDHFRNKIRKLVKNNSKINNKANNKGKTLIKHLSIRRISKESSMSVKRRFYTESKEKMNELPTKSSKQFANFLNRRDLFSARSKRQTSTNADNNQTSQFPHIQNLRRIESFFSKSEYCRQYFNRLQQNNERYLQKFTKSVKYNMKPENFVQQITDELDQIFGANKFEKLSIASPKVTSMF
jgi:hypothetical protein